MKQRMQPEPSARQSNRQVKRKRTKSNTAGLTNGHVKDVKEKRATKAKAGLVKEKRATKAKAGLVKEKRATKAKAGLASAKTPELNENQGMLEDAKVVVGIDFGTTCSGFAYALMDDPEKIETYYDWPRQLIRQYCKTQTSLWYLPGKSIGTYDLQNWGWLAQRKYWEALEETSFSARRSVPLTPALTASGRFFTNFKLYLAEGAGSNYVSQWKLEKLPEGLSVERMLTDYLREISNVAMAELHTRCGGCVRKKDVKWCLSVPTIWTEAAKHTMYECAQRAGLVHGPHCHDADASLDKLEMVLEGEAASLYCQQKLKSTHFRKGSKFLVVDAGGGTVDLVVHEKVDDSGLRVKEVTRSTGDLCGGIFVDLAFRKYLGEKIDCFENVCAESPTTLLRIESQWETFKSEFEGNEDVYSLYLPKQLKVAWKARQKATGSWTNSSQADKLEITGEDMRSIFDSQVNKILTLISDQLAQVQTIEAIMVVGGFSNSHYLMKRIRDQFSHLVNMSLVPLSLDPQYVEELSHLGL